MGRAGAQVQIAVSHVPCDVGPLGAPWVETSLAVCVSAVFSCVVRGSGVRRPSRLEHVDVRAVKRQLVIFVFVRVSKVRVCATWSGNPPKAECENIKNRNTERLHELCEL
jgi:hypothetical protein